jgi:hypothetical protein
MNIFHYQFAHISNASRSGGAQQIMRMSSAIRIRPQWGMLRRPETPNDQAQNAIFTMQQPRTALKFLLKPLG